MRNFKIILLFFLLNCFYVFSLDVIVKNDNGNPRLSGYTERYFWEESKILSPSGPCVLKKILIYFVGDNPAIDTIYVAGDPSEGYLPPTLWVASYNLKLNPIIFNYPGKPGWYEFNVDNLMIAGLENIVVQHRLNQGGPWFAVDNDGQNQPYSSFLMNPFETNSIGGPGNFYLANGDFLVRMVVEYQFPKDSTSAKPPFPSFVDITKDVGITDNNGNPIPSSDASVVDWNNDGFDDIAIGSYFFQNDGNGRFVNVSAKVNITASMTSWGDFNNDGFIDCYALRNGSYDENLKMVLSQDRIYQNNGDGTFTSLEPREIFKLPYPNPSEDFRLPNPASQDSIPNPYNCITPLWSDFNNDGKLDLFLANNRVGVTISGNYVERYFPDQLWIQELDGKFINITKSCGFLQYETFSNNFSALGYYDCYGANACDYNNDGKIDIFVANYRLARDFLYKNNGNLSFTNVGDVTGVQGVPTADPNYFGHGMGCEWGDFNNDGYPDLAVGNLGHPDWRGMYSNPSLIFENAGPPSYNFREVHSRMGLKFYEMNAGVTWGDFDLDGYLDLWHGQISYRAEGDGGEPKRPGRVYFNQGPPDYKLFDKTWETGLVVHGPWNAVRIDFDNDGDLDLLVASSHEGVKLFRNDLARKGNWVGFRLIGSPTNRVNMDCYGTKVFVYCGSNNFYRDLMGSISGNRCSQNSNSIHFGIGRNEIIDSVKVIYPNGFVKTYVNVVPNRYYLVRYNQDLIPLKISSPQCIYPRNYQLGLGDSVYFEWTKVGGAESYELIISEDKEFQNLQKFVTTNVNETIKGFTKSKQFFWKVRSVSAKDTSNWSSVFSFYTGFPVPPRVSLLTPQNTMDKLSLTPKFVWSKPIFPYGLEVDYWFELQISKDETFDNLIYSKAMLTDTFFVMEDGVLSPGNQYYWRVRAINLDGQGQWSDVYSFRTNTLPERITLLSPENNSRNVSLKPTFRWQTIDNVDEYVFQLSSNSNFDSVLVERNLQATLYKQLVSLLPGVTYYWRVCGKNNVGLGPWSDVWSFETSTSSGVEIIKNDFIKVYPNPFVNDLNIVLSEPTEAIITVYDILGREVSTSSTENENITLDLSFLSIGTYYIRVQCKNKESKNFLIYKLNDR